MTKTMRRAVMAGLGMETKLREVVDDLVQRGERSETDCAKLTKRVWTRVEEGLKELQGKEEECVSILFRKLHLVSREDLKRMETRIEELAALLKRK
jgi:polyhydroxyalkanoate synthesis regulator phasin